MQQALHERQVLIEQRTRDLSEQALRRREPWLSQFGTPPAEPGRRELWYRHVDTVAAYRERWDITGSEILGPQTHISLEQEADKTLVQRAVDAASQHRRTDPPPLDARHRGTDPQLDRCRPEPQI